MASPAHSCATSSSASSPFATDAGNSLQTLSPTVNTNDLMGRAQPWRELVPDRYWVDVRPFDMDTNKGPRADVRLLLEIDAISR
jgi:hypothetical protein